MHAMRDIFEEDDCDAVLLVDAANAFNSINRGAMLENILRLCPIAYVYAYNCYAPHARLFVVGGRELRSKEGTTQGDPVSMGFYGLGLIPLLSKIKDDDVSQQSKHVAYADDLTGGGRLRALKRWFDNVVKYGPPFGYHAEPSKSWLVVKESLYDDAVEIFKDTSVNITKRGKKHLGAAIGQMDFRKEFMDGLVKDWVAEIEALASVASFEPQATYSAFATCIRHRYTYLMRTIPCIDDFLQPLGDAIRHKLIPALTEGRSCSDDDRILLSLPVRLGGLGIIDPSKIADEEFQNSRKMTENLTAAIKSQQRDIPDDLDDLSRVCKLHIRTERRARQVEVLEDLKLRMSPDQIRVNEIAKESGSSNWLTCLPLEDSAGPAKLGGRGGYGPPTFLPSKVVCGTRF